VIYAPAMGFAAEIWARTRPYLVNRVVEFTEAATLWLSLYLMKALTIHLKIGGWVESFVIAIHEVATVVAFVFLAYYGVVDIVRSKVKASQSGEQR